MIFRAWLPTIRQGKNLLRYKVKYETNKDYKKGVDFLLSKGLNIIAIVCDGRIGLLNGFGDIPTQMCIVHQQRIIRRYLTKRPRLEANKELKEITNDLGIWREETMYKRIEDWHRRNKEWLYEKNENNNYKHDRTIKAYKSIRKNLYYLYTFKRYPDLGIPKTNNSLESINSHLKTKNGIHRGLKEHRKDKFISYYLRLS